MRPGWIAYPSNREMCESDLVFYLTRGFEDDHYWVARETDGVLVETPWRVELEEDGYRLSHADSAELTTLVYNLGALNSARAAVERLRTVA